LTRNLAATIATVALTVLSLAFASASFAEDNARGKVLFDLCKQCHGPAGGGMTLSLAPAIAGMDEWYVDRQLKNFKSGIRGLHADDLGGLRMYPMSQWLKTDEDIAAVSNYVANLTRVSPAATIEGGDAAKGAAAYGLCATCHGKEGEGVQLMNGPPLRGVSDWYLKTTLEKFKAGTRGANSKNPNEMMMRGMAMSLADEQAIKNVIAHIMTFNK
jgi:cytochrome c oxidase subunit 2